MKARKNLYRKKKNRVEITKKLFCLLLVFLISINSFAAVVSDNDGSAFITKGEFDKLKHDFATQIDEYNKSIDYKIDGAIASYLAGIKTVTAEGDILTQINSLSPKGYLEITNTGALGSKETIGFKCHIASLFRCQNTHGSGSKNGVYEGLVAGYKVDTGSDSGNAIIYTTQNGQKILLKKYSDYYILGECDAWSWGTYSINGYSSPYPQTCFENEQNSTFVIRLYDSSFISQANNTAGGVRTVRTGETNLSGYFFWNGQTHTSNSWNFISLENIEKRTRSSSTTTPTADLSELWTRKDTSPYWEPLWGTAGSGDKNLYKYYSWSPTVDSIAGIKAFVNNIVYTADDNIWWGWDKGIPIWRVGKKESTLYIPKSLRFYNRTSTSSSRTCTAKIVIYDTVAQTVLSTPWSSSSVANGTTVDLSTIELPAGYTMRLIITASATTNDIWSVALV